MPRKTKDGQPFNDVSYRQQWNKQNMKSVGASYKAEFVEEYKRAAQKLGLKTSDLIRQVMLDTIEKAKSLDSSS
ncbi:MAG: hypothetical protein K2H85_08545 [Allobaculum sp.]|nr:hypothetical protein [Allobaculum sp.]